MAPSTVGSEFSVVNVVRPMAVATVVAGCAHGSQGAAMAIVTRNVEVAALERKVRLRVVIEQPQVPRDRVMA